MKPQDILAPGKGSLWIFGYGSLVWKPDFKYKRSEVGHIRGYKRRFWHGDNFHRGNDELPGRVVTLIEEDDVSGVTPTGSILNFSVSHLSGTKLPGRTITILQASTWGVAFEVCGAQAEESLKYLNVRETVRGGYVTKTVEFYPEGAESSPVPALVYIATADNPLYLGPASAQEIGAQIATRQGKSGHNLEYLLRLAEFMRTSCPFVDDGHLFAIEAAALGVVSLLLAAQ